jgi:2,3-bisphosphoglycerate-dependent phosphoglycerate mutase
VRLVLVRHGLPERVTDADGERADPALTELGHRQAERVVHALAGEPVDAIYASTMTRAVQTAAPLASARGLEIVQRHDLREFDADQPRYLPVHELARENPQEWQRMVEGHLPEHVDVPAFTARVLAALDEIVAAHPGRGTAVVFAHAGVVNVFLGHLLGISRPLPFPLDYAGVTRVVARRDGVRKPRTVNEIGHVADLL